MAKIHKLDATGLLCPMPVIKVQQVIKELKPGEYVEVTCTDPGTQYDIPAWCRVHEHNIVFINKKDRKIIICIEIK